jgi:hypothetical protein
MLVDSALNVARKSTVTGIAAAPAEALKGGICMHVHVTTASHSFACITTMQLASACKQCWGVTRQELLSYNSRIMLLLPAGYLTVLQSILCAIYPI